MSNSKADFITAAALLSARANGCDCHPEARLVKGKGDKHFIMQIAHDDTCALLLDIRVNAPGYDEMMEQLYENPEDRP